MIMYSQWVSLSLATRNKLANIFGIIKKGSTEVASNVIKSDGYLVEDIEKALTQKAMQDYLDVGNTDIADLFKMVVSKAEGKEVEGGVSRMTEKQSKMATLPPEEAKEFKKEYDERKKEVRVKRKYTKRNVK